MAADGENRMIHPHRLRPLALLAAIALGACASQPAMHSSEYMTDAAPDQTPGILDDLDAANVASLQAAMQRGDISAAELTQRYLDRIAAIDDAGPP